MTKRVCISGYYGFNNFGDEMILKILIQNLKEIENTPEITVFSVNPNYTSEQLNVKSVNTFNIFNIIQTVKNTDFLISGGGSLLQDASSSKSLLYYLFVIASAFFFRKKVIIFAQGIGPINNIILKKLTLFLLKRACYITVRDENSLNLLLSNNITAEKCSDPVWNISAIRKYKQDNNNPARIGIQLRDFPLITDEFIYKLAQNVNKYYFNQNIFIFSLQNTIDLKVCEKFKSVLSEINPKISVKIIQNTNNDKVIEDICSLDKFIAMRYHACLIAIKAGIEVLPIIYDIKVKTLANKYKLNCITSVNDIDISFKDFQTTNTYYKEIKNNTPEFDFAKLKSILC